MAGARERRGGARPPHGCAGLSRRYLLRAAGAGAAGALAAMLPGCTRRPREPLRVGLPLWPPFELAFFARELGLLEGAPLQLVEYASPPEVMRDIQSGAIDVAGLTLDYVVQLAAVNPGLRIVIACDYSNGADALIARPPIKDVTALRGRRVGVEAGALGAHVLTRGLDKGGLSLADITIVRIDAADQERAFLNEEVDALVTFEPTLTRLMAAGAKTLFSSVEIPGEIADVLIASERARTAGGAALRRLLQGWFAALDRLRAGPQEAAARISSRVKLTPGEFSKALGSVVMLDRSRNQRLLSAKDPSLLAALETSARLLRKQGVDVGPGPWHALLDGRFLGDLER